MARHPMNRRRFLQATAASVAAPLIIPRHVLGQDGSPGANERVKVGIIGLGLRIRQLLNWPKEMYLQAVCDCNAPQIPSFLNWYKEVCAGGGEGRSICQLRRDART